MQPVGLLPLPTSKRYSQKTNLTLIFRIFPLMQTELFLPAAAPTNWDTISNRDLRSLALLPIGGIPDGPGKSEAVATWLNANRVAYSRIAQEEISAFKAIGSAQKWFSEWSPQSQLMQKLSDAMEEAYDVIERHYPAIASRGLDNSEDMGVLASMGLGKSEGILAKFSAYDRSCLHLEIHCVTGPVNHVPGEGIEFEVGSESHVFHLAYISLPSLETLLADICTYPLIRLPENAYITKSGKEITYRSEGFTGQLANTGILVHRPWNSHDSEAHARLMTLLH